MRKEIRAERISYEEIAELQSLAKYIDPSDVELLEWAGVPEFPDDDDSKEKGGWLFGGSDKKPKSAIMRDRKYTSQEEHEKAYKDKRKSRVRYYKKED